MNNSVTTSELGLLSAQFWGWFSFWSFVAATCRCMPCCTKFLFYATEIWKLWGIFHVFDLKNLKFMLFYFCYHLKNIKKESQTPNELIPNIAVTLPSQRALHLQWAWHFHLLGLFPELNYKHFSQNLFDVFFPAFRTYGKGIEPWSNFLGIINTE